jgi:hypothetical protein
MAYVPPELLKCVVFLGYVNQKNEEKLAGSAFWVSRIPYDDIKGYQPAYLVTAAHVLDQIRADARDNKVRVRVNLSDGGQEWRDTFLGCWKVYPDPAFDLAILKIGIDEAIDHVAFPQSWFISKQSMEDDGRKIELGDELFFAGLFYPHTGEKKNIPIVRVGNVAALRDEPVLNRDGHLMDAYLVESRSIAGLSGSPVFIDVLLAKQVHQGARSYITGSNPSKFRLVGVIHGHFDWDDAEPDVVADDGRRKLGVNMGIAIVVPAEKIVKVMDEFMAVEEEREAKEYRLEHSSLTVGNPEMTTNVTFQAMPSYSGPQLAIPVRPPRPTTLKSPYRTDDKKE